MMACSLYLRKPPPCLISSYLKTVTSCTSLIRDPIAKPAPLLSTVKAAALFSSSCSEKLDSSIKTSSSPAPWLMLTPEIKLTSGTDTVFKFYALAEEKVISVDRKNLKDQLGLGSKQVGVDLECMGSSHGWLVLLDRSSYNLFLYNPLSNRHLKLPTVRKLESFEENDWGGYLHMTKVIISSSDPEGDANCRALMIHGVDDKLAFCCPKSSDQWTETHRRYNDVVCGGDSDSMLFFGVDDSVRPYYPEFEGWDLKDVSRPMLISLEDRIAKDFVGKTFPWKGYSSFKKPWTRCREANFLVPAAADKSIMYYVCLKGGDLSYVNEEGDYHFHVHKFDFESGKLVYMDRSLDGLALFVGRNHSFALSAANAAHVKPNSIYFTHPADIDNYTTRPLDRKQVKIYNYEDGTFSPPFYTVTKITSHQYRTEPPMWYTP